MRRCICMPREYHCFLKLFNVWVFHHFSVFRQRKLDMGCGSCFELVRQRKYVDENLLGEPPDVTSIVQLILPLR